MKAKAFLARPKRLYINGEFVDAADGETFETEDPALGAAITEVSSAKKEDVERAAVAARDAFDKRWSTLAPAQRGAYLSKLADLISENLEGLSRKRVTSIQNTNALGRTAIQSRHRCTLGCLFFIGRVRGRVSSKELGQLKPGFITTLSAFPFVV